MLEGELQASEERYRLLFEEMTSAFALHKMIFDESGKPCDYEFLQVNPAFEKLTGLSAGDVVGRRVPEVLPDTEFSWIARYGRWPEPKTAAIRRLQPAPRQAF